MRVPLLHFVILFQVEQFNGIDVEKPEPGLNGSSQGIYWISNLYPENL